MYLISLYFDERTEDRIRDYMRQIAKNTGNDAMLSGSVPPHLTVLAFQCPEEETAVEIFEAIASRLSSGSLQWVSVGSFFPQVLYLAPVLNEYLHNVSVVSYKEASVKADINIGNYYRPFGWFPHTTLAKQLTPAQMQTAFATMQNQFGGLEGTVRAIGLAKTNPYTDLGKYVFK